MLFNRGKYADENISKTAEKILSKKLQINRLHGSRDYFSANYQGFYLEFVPVLEIKKASEAQNITDCSPLHAKWISTRANAKLKDEIRLAKLFFKANGVYGAESYLSGFSGHVTEILTIYYKGFLNLMKAAQKWKEKEVIDLEKYKTSKEINKSKRESALVIVDPVEPYRNSAAALGFDKFNKLKIASKKFLSKPSTEFFKEKEFDIKELVKKKKDRRLIVLTLKAENGKSDVVGSKLLKIYENLKKDFLENDFDILETDWHWKLGKLAVLWFYFGKKELSKTKIHFGPPSKMEKFAKQFKKKYKNAKVSKGRLVAVLKRRYTSPEQLIKDKLKIIKLENHSH
jgi:tRNA nucleotidyltransferase (CCA-adding enzyme)